MILTDTQIVRLCERGELISEDFDLSSVNGCAYEFRVSRFAHRYDYERRSAILEERDSHVIYPFESLVIVTQERLRLGSKHFLQVHLKGSLFALGIVPVCTAADPGFSNHLGLTLTNISARPIELRTGMRFAKGVFHELDRAAERMYTGQHGDARLTWPYPGHLHVLDFDQTKYAAEMRRFLPSPLADTIGFLDLAKNYLKWIAAIQVLALASWVMGTFSSRLLSDSFAQRAYDGLSIFSGICSIISLLLTVAVMVRATHKD